MFPRKTEAILVVPGHFLIVIEKPAFAHESLGPMLGVIYNPIEDKCMTIKPRAEVVETVMLRLDELPSGQFIPVIDGEKAPPIHPRNIFVKDEKGIRRMFPRSGKCLADVDPQKDPSLSVLNLGNIFLPKNTWPLALNKEALRQLPTFPG
ncbi:MAG: hypothetical protein PHP25_03900 [Candidatus Moranbacteria bacterium]|nr:hypothetical protein [Candidatus Moranbacteria bacterium]